MLSRYRYPILFPPPPLGHFFPDLPKGSVGSMQSSDYNNTAAIGIVAQLTG